MDSVYLVSSPRSALLLLASMQGGLLGGLPGGRRVLVTSDTSWLPEACDAPPTWPLMDRLAEKVDSVVSWNELVAPYHPRDWVPRFEDWPLWERRVREAWSLGIDGPIELVIEPPHQPPALSLAMVLPMASITVLLDGLTVYGEQAHAPPHDVYRRIRRVLFPPLVPDGPSRYLAELDPQYVPVPLEAQRMIASQSGRVATPEWLLGGRTTPMALVVSHRSSAEAPNGVEFDLRMMRCAAKLGAKSIVYVADGALDRSRARELADSSGDLGVGFGVVDGRVLLESVIANLRPDLVVATSTDALRARATGWLTGNAVMCDDQGNWKPTRSVALVVRRLDFTIPSRDPSVLELSDQALIDVASPDAADEDRPRSAGRFVERMRGRYPRTVRLLACMREALRSVSTPSA